MGQSASRLESKSSQDKGKSKRLSVTNYGNFNAKRPDDEGKVRVTGILCIAHTIVVVDGTNCLLKLFDEAGIHVSSTVSRQIPWGITKVHGNVFATCGNGNKEFLWSMRGQSIVSEGISYNIEYPALRVHFNGSFYCLLHTTVTAITLLDKEGSTIKKIFNNNFLGRKITFGRDIHMDTTTNNIFVISTEESGVLCITKEGQALWFCPLPLAFCINEIHEALCVADPWNKCLYLITKEGKRMKKLLCKEDLKGSPVRVEYGHKNKLYVSFDQNDKHHSKISVFTV